MAASYFTGGAVPATSTGGGFGEHFASGGISRGGWATVGERGPELVNLPRGAQVIPNDALMARRSQRENNIAIHINVPQGTQRESAAQIAARTAAGVSHAMRYT
jgi:phage-related tail protein